MGKPPGVCPVPRAEVAVTAGTIVTVDFAVVEGRLADVRPGPSLPSSVGDVLTRVPADLEPAALAARIRAAIPFGVPWPAGASGLLADAIREAIGVPTTSRIGSFTPAEAEAITAGWRAYPWRLLPEAPLSAATNVALDEVLNDRGSPCLRFWRWAEPAVVVGRCQSIQSEVNGDALTADGLALVRRISGGGTMFVQPHGTITYSLILPEEAVAGLTIRQSYEACDAWVVRGLRELGVDAHHVPVNDIACGDGKIGGAAQARRRGGVLHHTTIAYALDMGEMTKYLRLGREKPAASGVASAAKVVSPLVAQVRHSRETVVTHLLRLFQRLYGGTIDALSPDELSAATDLARTKYGNPDWTHEFP